MKENNFTEKLVAFGRRIGRRNWVIIGAVVLVATAICLNVFLFGGANGGGFDYDGDETEASGTPNGGGNDASNVGAEDGYFSSVQVSRQRARDEALEVLQSVVENEKADEAAKTEALTKISKLAAEMEQESNIETLVLAKGFEACVAVVNDGSASIVVKCKEGGLVQSQISQINEIVYEQAGIEPVNINIIER